MGPEVCGTNLTQLMDSIFLLTMTMEGMGFVHMSGSHGFRIMVVSETIRNMSIT